MSVYYQREGVTLIKGNALTLTNYIEPESVDLIVTSPPYFALRSYQDNGAHYEGQIGDEDTPEEFLQALWEVTAQCWQVLKPTGSLFVNLGDKYSRGTRTRTSPEQTMLQHTDKAAKMSFTDNRTDKAQVRAKSLLGLPWRYALGCTDDNGHAGGQWVLRAEIIWAKANGMPEPVTDRVVRRHEQFFHLTKNETYFAAIDELRTVNGEDLGSLPVSWWRMPMEPLTVPEWLQVEHFAAFPTEWPRRLVLGWTPQGYCLECDQPRAPKLEKFRVVDYDKPSKVRGPKAVGNNAQSTEKSGEFGQLIESKVVITGYQCACDNTNAPTRPAVVLDPFGGTGTTAMVARSLERHAIHVDLSEDYLKLAKWRIFDSGHATKALERTYKDRQQGLF